MRRAMDRLSGLVRRRRKLVLGVWVVLLLASLRLKRRGNNVQTRLEAMDEFPEPSI